MAGAQISTCKPSARARWRGRWASGPAATRPRGLGGGAQERFYLGRTRAGGAGAERPGGEGGRGRPRAGAARASCRGAAVPEGQASWGKVEVPTLREPRGRGRRGRAGEVSGAAWAGAGEARGRGAGRGGRARQPGTSLGAASRCRRGRVVLPRSQRSMLRRLVRRKLVTAASVVDTRLRSSPGFIAAGAGRKKARAERGVGVGEDAGDDRRAGAG